MPFKLQSELRAEQRAEWEHHHQEKELEMERLRVQRENERQEQEERASQEARACCQPCPSLQTVTTSGNSSIDIS